MVDGTGKKADLIMVEGNPLDDLGLLFEQDNILLVMRDGRIESTDEARRRYLRPRACRVEGDPSLRSG